MSDLPADLRRLFADEAATRLARLSEDLLALEESGDDAELVASVFRDAHTLKGSAGMMGLTGFAAVAHRMEDLLAQVRAGTRRLTPPLADAVLAAVDVLRAQVPAIAGEGELDRAALAEAEAALAALIDADPPASPALASPRLTPSASAADARGVTKSAGKPAEAAAGPKPDLTIRVPLARLDELSRLAAEASAAATRLTTALVERLGRGRPLPPELDELRSYLRDLNEGAARARMVPVAGVVEPLRRAARDIARAQGKDVRFEVVGADTELDRGVLSHLSDPLLHLVRNAVDHGVEPPAERAAAGKPAQATVRLEAAPRAGHVRITVSDDGRGVDVERVAEAAAIAGIEGGDAIDLLFRPGFTTAPAVTDVSGRGVGLDVVRSALDPLHGRVEVRSEAGRGAAFVMTVPLTVAAVECLVVEVAGRPYALPMESVAATQAAQPGDTSLAALLGMSIHRPPRSTVVLSDGDRARAFGVASVVDHRDLVVTGLPPVVPTPPIVAGAAVDRDGSVIVVLDPARLLDLGGTTDVDQPLVDEHRARLLVVDDAAVVRRVQHATLTRAGYEVQTAVDGADALARLREWPADLVVVDIEMPVMDGLEFTRAVRRDPVLRGTAILMLTSLGSDEDRRRGLEAGADGYLAKGAVTPDRLLDAVARLLGRDR